MYLNVAKINWLQTLTFNKWVNSVNNIFSVYSIYLESICMYLHVYISIHIIYKYIYYINIIFFLNINACVYFYT